MSEQINEMELQRQFEEMNARVAETCQSEEDVMKLFGGLPEGGNGELKEEDLAMVVGGMSTWKAIQIVSVAYWDLCIKKKKKTSYSDKQIFEALRVVDKANTVVKGVSLAALTWGLRKLGIPVPDLNKI